MKMSEPKADLSLNSLEIQLTPLVVALDVIVLIILACTGSTHDRDLTTDRSSSMTQICVQPRQKAPREHIVSHHAQAVPA